MNTMEYAPDPEPEEVQYRWPGDEPYVPIGRMPGYEINRYGQVRNARTKRPVKERQHPASFNIIYVACAGVSSQVNVLLEETFGPGAAQAAGLPPPDMDKVSKSRARAQQNGYVSRRESATGSRRHCATCKKPTTDYRCPACWIKVRGYAAADTAYGE